MDDEMLKKARAAIVDAALDWFVETQMRTERVFSPVEEKLRVAVLMYRKTRSISGQIDLSEVRKMAAKSSGEE